MNADFRNLKKWLKLRNLELIVSFKKKAITDGRFMVIGEATKSYIELLSKQLKIDFSVLEDLEEFILDIKSKEYEKFAFPKYMEIVKDFRKECKYEVTDTKLLIDIGDEFARIFYCDSYVLVNDLLYNLAKDLARFYFTRTLDIKSDKKYRFLFQPYNERIDGIYIMGIRDSLIKDYEVNRYLVIKEKENAAS